MSKKPPRPFTIHDAAEELDLRPSTARKLAHDGKLGPRRLVSAAERKAYHLPANTQVLTPKGVRAAINRRRKAGLQ